MKRLVSGPYLIWMAVFIIVPLFFVVYYAFTNDASEFTFDNFTTIVKYAPIFGKSLWLAVLSTIICLLIAYPFAFIISRKSERSQGTMIMLIMLPMWINFLLRTYAWMTLLEKEGIINKILGIIGIGPLPMINTQGAVVLGMVYNYLPFMVLPLYSIMCKIDKSVIEAAQDLGSNKFQLISRVIIPLSMPGVVTGIIMVFVPSVSTFAISRMLGGGSNMLIGDLIEEQFLGGAYNPYVGSSLSLILMVIILVIIGIMNRMDQNEMEGMLV